MSVAQRRNRLRRRVPLSRHAALRHGSLHDRPDRLAGLAVQHEQQTLLRRLCERLDGFAVLHGVDEDRRGWDVVVPERVMRRLKVPAALAGAQIDGDDALAVQVRAGPQAAVHVAVRRFDGQIREPELLVRGDRPPNTRVARALALLGGTVEPRLVARLTAPRDGMERPEQLARDDVEAADVADRRCWPDPPARAACARRPRSTTSFAIVGGEFKPIWLVSQSSP